MTPSLASQSVSWTFQMVWGHAKARQHDHTASYFSNNMNAVEDLWTSKGFKIFLNYNTSTCEWRRVQVCVSSRTVSASGCCKLIPASVLEPLVPGWGCSGCKLTTCKTHYILQCLYESGFIRTIELCPHTRFLWYGSVHMDIQTIIHINHLHCLHLYSYDYCHYWYNHYCTISIAILSPFLHFTFLLPANLRGAVSPYNFGPIYI